MNHFAIFLRGMAMGVAELIPGVSGGTIALVTGIYDRLVHAIRSIDVEALRLVLRGRVRAACAHVDGGFLIALVAGMGTAVVVLAGLLRRALETTPPVVWAFFLGLMVAAFVLMLRDVLRARDPARLGLLGLGVAVGVAFVLAPQTELEAGSGTLFLGGAVAICAWVLPGVSGGYLLLLLGLYVPVISAIDALDLARLLPFAAGAGLGLFVFVRVLDWALERHHDEILAVLTGFVGGAAVRLWPWQGGRHCELAGPFLLPGDYATRCGDPLPLAVLVATLAGAGGLFLLHRASRTAAGPA